MGSANNVIKSLGNPKDVVKNLFEDFSPAYRSSVKKIKDQKRENTKLRSSLAQQQILAQEELKKRAIAEESTRLQKEKARKQTIFAGAQENKPLFQKTLGTRSIFG